MQMSRVMIKDPGEQIFLRKEARPIQRFGWNCIYFWQIYSEAEQSQPAILHLCENVTTHCRISGPQKVRLDDSNVL